jgi:hypothetical protein
MINLGDIQDPQLNFKQGDVQVHSIWQGTELVWPANSGLVFINANWRVLPPWPVFAEVWTSDGSAPPNLFTKLWTSELFNILQTGCMNFGVYGPLDNTGQQYVVRIRKPTTISNPFIPLIDPERNINSPGSTAGYGVCPDNSFLNTQANAGQVLISGNQAYGGYPQLVFDIFNVS